MPKKILICFGTRPEAIKLTSLILGLKKHRHLKAEVLFTGQHLDLAQDVMKLFNWKADYNLKVMTPNQTLESLSARLLEKIEKILEQIQPDCVLVQGDTTSAFLIGLAAFYKKIPVGHVEAGLRSFDKYQPFPEEINRRLITQIADFHFAPTPLAQRQLFKEDIAPGRVLCTGNTGIDALLAVKKILAKKKKTKPDSHKKKRSILVTVHRRESFGLPIRNIFQAILKIAGHFPDVDIFFPVHPNPNVQKAVKDMLSAAKNIHLMKPVAYDVLADLMLRASLILTDSGGIQEEAPTFHKPILVLRNVTERPEGVKAGFSILVGQDPEKIFCETAKILNHPAANARLKNKKNPYGDGLAAERIIRFLVKNLQS